MQLEIDQMTQAIVEMSQLLKERPLDRYHLGVVRGYLHTTNAPAEVLQSMEALLGQDAGGEAHAVPVPPAIVLVTTPPPVPEPEPVARVRRRYKRKGPAPLRPKSERDELILRMKREKKSEKEIAEVLGISHSAVSQRWSRMRKADPRAATIPKGFSMRKRKEPVAKKIAAPAVRRRVPVPNLTEEQRERYRSLKAQNRSIQDIARALKLPVAQIYQFNRSQVGITTLTGEVTTYVDEQGRRITLCPPGYAMGARPNQVVMPRGGV